MTQLDRTQVEALWEQHATGIRRFVLGVVRDPDLADEVLQQTFVTTLERGHTSASETRKGWLYRVAFTQAMELKRRAKAGDKAVGSIQEALRVDPPAASSAADTAIRRERIERLRSAIAELPAAQRTVVEMRLGASKTFQAIADELGVPLSTALTRMRLATEKLKARLES